ncbi:CD48 antigen-like isoform X1 [Thunnus thynnus]|uniref:CD48 antigen-like isoform X1 n=1 Tax=Thunnus thynnus TaxID=8237 RepID=UPI003528567E
MEAQMRIILFLMVMISSDTEAEKNLTSTEGGSITLRYPLVELGFLLRGIKNVAMVNEKKMQILEDNYKNRLHWDNNTGFFTITGLQRSDSGIYTFDSKKGTTPSTSYKLTVYESVSTPAVKRLSVSAESCILLCSVEKAEETTLLWYKDKEILNQSSSALSLLLTVHKQDSNSSYSCVAANPAEKKTLPVNITTSCSEQNNTDNSDDTNTRYYFVTGIIISIVLAEFVVLIAIIAKKKCLNKTKTTIRQTQGRFGEHRHRCILYCMQISGDRRFQDIRTTQKNDSSITEVIKREDGSQMTSIKDKCHVKQGD